MNKYKVYKAKFVPCEICKEKQGILLPICIIDGEEKMLPVCMDCRDKVPYEIIPVRTVMDAGYYFYKGEMYRFPDEEEE